MHEGGAREVHEVAEGLGAEEAEGLRYLGYLGCRIG